MSARDIVRVIVLICCLLAAGVVENHRQEQQQRQVHTSVYQAETPTTERSAR